MFDLSRAAKYLGDIHQMLRHRNPQYAIVVFLSQWTWGPCLVPSTAGLSEFGVTGGRGVSQRMLNESLKQELQRSVLPNVQMPAQYLGGEWNSAQGSQYGKWKALPRISGYLYDRHESPRSAGALFADECQI